MVDPHKLAQASLFFKLFCRASDLQTDLAKRIMYSVIPHVATPAEMYHTQGIIDQRALKAAAEGRHRIIDYGIQAISDELNHTYNVDKDDIDESYKKRYDSLVENKSFRMALAYAGKIFERPNLWARNYGGTLWKIIADCLSKLVSLDIQLAKIKYDKQENYRPELLEAELETLRQIVTQMNIFDGLIHNSDSIMSKLVEIEKYRKLDPAVHNEKNEDTVHQDIVNSKNILNQLQDAKELSSPVDVFRIIAPTLEGSGDINRYKDWVSKLTKLPEYRRPQKEINQTLSQIRLRKELFVPRQDLSKQIEELKKIKQVYLSNDKEIFNAKYRNMIGTFVGRISGLAAQINPQFNINPLDDNLRLQLVKGDKLGKIIASLAGKVHNELWDLKPDSNSKKIRDNVVDLLTELIGKSQQFNFFLDAI